MPFGGLLTVGIIGAGASLGSAALGAHAAGKASDQQLEATEKALALQKEMYQQQRADTAPWRQTGGAAVQTLGGLMGLGGLGGGSAMASTPSLNVPYSPQNMPPRGSSAGTMLDDNGNYVPINPSMGYPTNGSPGGIGQSHSSYAASSLGPMVKLKAPDGSVQSVPEQYAQHYLDMGAVRV